ncbi:MAG: biotin--[acetyl-CoA-carboxylase] ligase [Pseudomonadota bacterium]
MHTRSQQALFPILRRLSDGRFHSGEALAEAYGLSRATICNVMAQAEAMGLNVHAVRGRGYRLSEPVEWLDAETIRHALGEAAPAYTLTLHDVLPSTNTALMAAALDGAPDGTLVCTEHQPAGKGRRGRAWHAVPGGSLTFSVLWRFDGGLQAMAGLSLAVGLAIARAVSGHSRHPIQLKWPNDVLAGYRKLAGVLVEVQGDMHGAAFAVVGVGLNVRLSARQRDAIDRAVIDLAELGVTAGRNRILADCLRELHSVMTLFRREGFAALREDWQALDAYAGRPVVLSLAEAFSVSGVAAGVDASGALLLQGTGPGVQAYSGGELSLRLDTR